MAEKKTEKTEAPEVEAEAVTPGVHSTTPVQYFEKDTAYFVTLPNGVVTTARGRTVFNQLGTYVIEGTTYIVRDLTGTPTP